MKLIRELESQIKLTKINHFPKTKEIDVFTYDLWKSRNVITVKKKMQQSPPVKQHDMCHLQIKILST